MNAGEVLQGTRAGSTSEFSVRVGAPASAANQPLGPCPSGAPSPAAIYTVLPVDRTTAFEMVVKNHYLHRKTTFQRAFGLYDGDGGLAGVIIFGIPASFTLRCGICGPAESSHVIEINRIWVDDAAPKNGESFLIGGALRLLREANSPFDIVVSFADSGVGHLGRIYQATNFLYTGKSLAMRDPVPLDFKGHRLTAGKTTDLKAAYRAATGTEPTGMSTFNLMEWKFGKGKVGWVIRSPKHRYVIFNSNRRRERELRKKLTYPVLPYPRSEPKVAKESNR